METMLEMYLNELGTKQKLAKDLQKYNTPYLVLCTYTHVWEATPHLDHFFCTEVSQKLEMNIYLRNKGISFL